jgi:hypothetical protein
VPSSDDYGAAVPEANIPWFIEVLTPQICNVLQDSCHSNMQDSVTITHDSSLTYISLLAVETRGSETLSHLAIGDSVALKTLAIGEALLRLELRVLHPLTSRVKGRICAGFILPEIPNCRVCSHLAGSHRLATGTAARTISRDRPMPDLDI